MKIERQTEWIESGDFQNANPMPARITAVETKPNSWGKTDYLLYVRNESTGQIKAMSIYKKNLNVLIDKYGTDTELWLGKLIQISSITLDDNKSIREIKPL